MTMSIGEQDGSAAESHGEPAGSVFIFIFVVANLTVANKLEPMVFPHHLINGGDFGFLEGIPENRREV